MELKDTIKLMESDDYKDRLKAEYYQVKIRREKGKVWKFRKVGGDVIKDRVLNKWIPKIQSEKSQMTIFDIIN